MRQACRSSSLATREYPDERGKWVHLRSEVRAESEERAKKMVESDRVMAIASTTARCVACDARGRVRACSGSGPQVCKEREARQQVKRRERHGTHGCPASQKTLQGGPKKTSPRSVISNSSGHFSTSSRRRGRPTCATHCLTLVLSWNFTATRLEIEGIKNC